MKKRKSSKTSIIIGATFGAVLVLGVASKTVKPLINSDFDPVAFAMGDGHDGENWGGD